MFNRVELASTVSTDLLQEAVSEVSVQISHCTITTLPKD